jgi:hypothetical protein
MLVILNEPANRHIAINPEYVSSVEYNVHDANKRPVSRIVFNYQNSDGSPRDLLVLGTVEEIAKLLNKSGKS